jgi:hypothetical protein
VEHNVRRLEFGMSEFWNRPDQAAVRRRIRFAISHPFMAFHVPTCWRDRQAPPAKVAAAFAPRIQDGHPRQNAHLQCKMHCEKRGFWPENSLRDMAACLSTP